MKLPTSWDTRTETPSFVLSALGGSPTCPLARKQSSKGSIVTGQQFVRRSNETTQTWKKQFGSISHRAGLHGTKLRLRARRGQERRDLADSSGSRTRRHILRYRRSLRSIHERTASGRSSCSIPRSGGDRNEVRLGAESG